MDKDKQDYIVKLEKAISQKYGKEAINNPKRFWNDKKEKDYLEQIKEDAKKFKEIISKEEKVEAHGFLINKKLFNKDTNRSCPICGKYSFYMRDDMYMNKFECCKECYIQWVDNREERWRKGWRPSEEEMKDLNIRKGKL